MRLQSLFYPVLAFTSFTSVVNAATWHTVEWDAPQFTAMSGDFVIPALPPSGKYADYLGLVHLAHTLIQCRWNSLRLARFAIEQWCLAGCLRWKDGSVVDR